ncbi:hypothetical protein D9M69_335220 [compost metagenome]
MAATGDFGGLLRAVFVAGHHAQGARVELQRHFAFLARVAVGIQQHHPVAGQGTTHGTGLEFLARRVADQRSGFRLAEAVAQGQAPGLLDVFDDLRVHRLAGADQLPQAQARAVGGEVFLHQHPPDGGRCAEAGDIVAGQGFQQAAGGEARHVVDEHAGAGVPGREEAAPGVLGPAGGGDVQVQVAGLQADPVHGGKVADRVALVAVQHQLGLGGGAGGEVEQQRIGGQGDAVRLEFAGAGEGVGVVDPARHRLPDADTGVVARQAVELRGIGAAGDDVADPAAVEAVAQVFGGEQGGGGDDHRADLERAQHDLPERHFVAEHQQDALAALHAELAQVVGDAVGAAGQVLEAVALLAALVADDPERRGIVARGHGVEVVQRPVEFLELRPAEVTHGGGVVGAVGQEEVACSQEGEAVAVHGGYPGFLLSGLPGSWRWPDRVGGLSIGRRKSDKNAQNNRCVVQKSHGLVSRPQTGAPEDFPWPGDAGCE